jgi:hypothetical protein
MYLPVLTTSCRVVSPSAFKKGLGALLRFEGNLPQSTVDGLSKAFKGVRLIIFDECAMISLQELYEIHRRCHAARSMERDPSEPFATIHVLLAGDLYQLPPVGGWSMFEVPANPDAREKIDYVRRGEAGMCIHYIHDSICRTSSREYSVTVWPFTVHPI